MISTVFNEQNFYPTFIEDVRQAKFIVLLQSPFLSKRRVSKLEPTIRNCAARRVRICIFSQKAREPEKQRENEVLAERLRACGAHVTFRKMIHEKLATVDNEIFWDGSLNILSQSSSHERMTRTRSSRIVVDAILNHKLNDCDTCKRYDSRTLLICNSEVAQTKAIGRELSQHRKNFHMTQSDLARLVNVPQSVISAIETGKSNVALHKLLKVCRALHVELMPLPWHVMPVVGETYFKQV